MFFIVNGSPVPLQAQPLLVIGEGIGPAGPHRIRHAQIQPEDFLAIHRDGDEVLVPLHGPGVIVPFPVLGAKARPKALRPGLEVDPCLFKRLSRVIPPKKRRLLQHNYIRKQNLYIKLNQSSMWLYAYPIISQQFYRNTRQKKRNKKHLKMFTCSLNPSLPSGELT